MCGKDIMDGCRKVVEKRLTFPTTEIKLSNDNDYVKGRGNRRSSTSRSKKDDGE